MNPYLQHRRKAFTLFDPNALAYIQQVEAADGQSLEPGVRTAISNFVSGCKIDGTWDKIKACCILAGARTLSGALVPLVGAAPININFVTGDYNRKTGLLGNGSNKYLNSNRNGSADPQDSFHLSAWVSSIHNPAGTTPVGTGGAYIGNGGVLAGASHFGRGGGSAPYSSTFARSRSSTADTNIDPNPPTPGFYCMNRGGSASYTVRTGNTTYTLTRTSTAPASGNHYVFARNNGSDGFELPVTGQIAFYSIGESLNPVLLESRVAALIGAFASAIP